MNGLWIGIIGPLAVIVTAVVTARMARGAQKVITFNELAARLDRSEQRERIRDDYIHQLRDHISQGNPPPPPPWPAGLTT